MIFGQDRDQMRRFYREAWRKHREQQALEPLERVVAEVVRLHPEYHGLLEKGGEALDRDFGAEGGVNPFLHMGMHIAIQEQLATGQPPGIVEVYHRLMTRLQDAHEVEHRMMECLGEALWEAQRAGTAPDETRYLACLNRLT